MRDGTTTWCGSFVRMSHVDESYALRLHERDIVINFLVVQEIGFPWGFTPLTLGFVDLQRKLSEYLLEKMVETVVTDE